MAVKKAKKKAHYKNSKRRTLISKHQPNPIGIIHCYNITLGYSRPLPKPIKNGFNRSIASDSMKPLLNGT